MGSLLLPALLSVAVDAPACPNAPCSDSWKQPTFPGYDLVAVNPERGLSCRIQVKSRWATDFAGDFPIKNFDCDFVFCYIENWELIRERLATEAG